MENFRYRLVTNPIYMVTKFEFNGDKFSLFEKWIFMVTFCDIFGDANDLTQSQQAHTQTRCFLETFL